MHKADTKPAPSVNRFFRSSFVIHYSAFVLIALAALAIRQPQLGVRPMHTDESVNAFITGKLLAGDAYHYDPKDRYGPALVELTSPLVRLEGAKNLSDLTEAQLRLVPVLVGSATILLFGVAVELFGFIPCLVAALLFAFAPLSVYYSRYFIHETLFVGATLGLIVSGGRSVLRSSLLFAALAGLCAAVMLACKETAGLHFFALGLTAVIGWRLHAAKKMPVISVWLTGAIAFLVGGILLFTWGGQNWSALADLFRAIPHLAARAGGEGHEKPFAYYILLLTGGGSGAAICILALLGFYRTTYSFARLPLATYVIFIGVIYSAIPYKTPWLALNLWLPIALLAGFASERLWFASTKPSVRAALLFGAGALGLLIAHDTRQRLFDQPADERNPYAYAHTSEDLLGLRVDRRAPHQWQQNAADQTAEEKVWPPPSPCRMGIVRTGSDNRVGNGPDDMRGRARAMPSSAESIFKPTV